MWTRRHRYPAHVRKVAVNAYCRRMRLCKCERRRMNGDTDCGAEERSFVVRSARRNTDHTIQCNEPASFHIVPARPRGPLFQPTAAVSVSLQPGPLHRRMDPRIPLLAGRCAPATLSRPGEPVQAVDASVNVIRAANENERAPTIVGCELVDLSLIHI